jgi:hypothetical protein
LWASETVSRRPEDDFWEISAEQMALLLGFMRGYDVLRTGDEAHRSFITYPVDRLADGPFPDLANLHKGAGSIPPVWAYNPKYVTESGSQDTGIKGLPVSFLIVIGPATNGH